MAVYTDVSAEDLERFLAGYDLGELLSYKGIAEGVENSNFLVHTGTGTYILTLYEKRVAAGDVPFFLALMEHLAARGITCPQPVKDRSGGCTLGTLCGRPAADRHLPRRHVDAAARCRPLRRGRRGAGAHASGRRGFRRHGGATRSRSAAGGRCSSRRAERADSVQHGLRATIERSLASSKRPGRATCRRA